MDPPPPKPPEPPTPEPDDDGEAAPAESKTEPELTPAVARRVQLSLELEEILARASAEIAAAHTEVVAAVLAPGEKPPDMRATLDCYRRVMAMERRNITATDRACTAGREKIATLVSDRDWMIAAVSKQVARSRRRCAGLFGRQTLAALGLAGPLARGRAAIYEQGREVAHRMHTYEPEEDPEEEDDGGPVLKPWLTSLAGKLDDDLDTLQRTVEELEQERERNKSRFARRQRAMADFDPRYLSIGGLAEALVRVTGKTEEADRIHPSTRQLDRHPDDPDEET